MNEAAKGKKSLENKQYEEAIKHYTAALAITPSPDYLIQRSAAFLRAGNAEPSLIDAENAVHAALKRAKRELIVEAQFRRGCALYQLGRYGDAKFVFDVVKKMDEKHKLAPAWAQKTVMALQKLAKDDPKKQCSVQTMPDAGDIDSESSNNTTGPGAVTPDSNSAASTVASTYITPSLVQTPADKIRHEWYQNSDCIYLSLLVKGVVQKNLTVDIQKHSVSLSFPLANGSSYDFTLDPLFAEINPQRCITRIWPSKLELILVKVSSQKWGALESKEPVIAASDKSDGAAVSTMQTQPAGPAYPTSSKTGAKDWDKVTKEASAKLRDPDKATSAYDDDDFEGGDEANHFFQKLFKDASPEVRRAMMKSYTESNGTALSTNWDEVSKAKVETVPPDGMEAKAWEK